jgi:hypothetical protein
MSFLAELVMPGLVPGIHVLAALKEKTWMAGTSASGSDAVLWTAMPGHDAETFSQFQRGGTKKSRPQRGREVEAGYFLGSGARSVLIESEPGSRFLF